MLFQDPLLKSSPREARRLLSHQLFFLAVIRGRILTLWHRSPHQFIKCTWFFVEIWRCDFGRLSACFYSDNSLVATAHDQGRRNQQRRCESMSGVHMRASVIHKRSRSRSTIEDVMVKSRSTRIIRTRSVNCTFIPARTGRSPASTARFRISTQSPRPMLDKDIVRERSITKHFPLVAPSIAREISSAIVAASRGPMAATSKRARMCLFFVLMVTNVVVADLGVPDDPDVPDDVPGVPCVIMGYQSILL